MKYIYTSPSGTDTMEIETANNRVTGLVHLVEPVNSEPRDTVGSLQQDLEVYMRNRPDMTVEEALSVYAGGYASIREVEGGE